MSLAFRQKKSWLKFRQDQILAVSQSKKSGTKAEMLTTRLHKKRARAMPGRAFKQA
jgi:hypothetical protein